MKSTASSLVSIGMLAARCAVLAAIHLGALAQGSADTQAALRKIREVRLEDADTILGFATEGAALYERETVKLSGYEYCSQAVALAESGEFRQSLRAASKALHLAVATDDPKLLASAERDIAIVMSYSGELTKAESFAREALTHAGEHDRTIRGPALKTIADVQARRGAFADAVRTYEESADSSSERFRPLVLAAQVNALIGLGDVHRARAVLDALTAGRSDDGIAPQYARTQARLMMAEGHPRMALAVYGRMLAVDRGFDAPYERMWALEGSAEAELALGDKRAAALHLERAISTLDDVRAQFRSDEIKFGLFSETQSLFDRAIALDLDLDRPAAALEVSEQGRARALLDAIRTRTAVPASRSPVDVAAMQRILRPGETLLEFQSLPDELVAWVISSAQVRTVRIALGQARLDAAVAAFRDSVADARADTQALADDLGSRLIEPLEIPDGARLVIVPNGALHYLPFQALRVRGRYLVERHSIAITPSMKIGLELLQRERVRRDAVVAFGNPSIAPRFDLPGAEAEVLGIGRLFGASTTTYLRADATKSRFKEVAPATSILHVAAHAQADTVDPLHSRILLANEDGHASYLEAHEVLALDLSKVSLVTLSACESALGRIAHGDEVLGFPRSFLSAGADSMMASLWPVSDESTSLLMSTVYASLRNGQDLQTAMQAAQLKVMRTAGMEHPFFWAPFNVIGNWRLTIEH